MTDVHDNVIALGGRSAPVEAPWEVWRFAFERASEHWGPAWAGGYLAECLKKAGGYWVTG